MDEPAFASVRTANTHDRAPSTQIAVQALEEANQRFDRLVGILHDKLASVVLENAPEDRALVAAVRDQQSPLVAAVRDQQSPLAGQIFAQVDFLHEIASRLERLMARIDL